MHIHRLKVSPAQTEPSTANERAIPPPTFVDSNGRLIAMGDVHGDYDAAISALKLAGAIGDSLRWIGGDLTIVQTGDQLDRGDQERAIWTSLNALLTKPMKPEVHLFSARQPRIHEC